MRAFKTTIAFLIIIAIIVSPILVTGAQAAESNQSAGIVDVTYGSLNVRSAAGLNAAVVAKLPKGSYVTLMEKHGSWWKVEYAAYKYGYVSASYIKTLSGTYPANVATTGSDLNVRTGAGTWYPVKNSLANGSRVIVLSSTGGWSRVLFRGNQTGYISSQYLNGKMQWPVAGSRKINQNFVSGSHLGLDVGAYTRGVPGDGVVAAVGGEVVYSGWLNGYGYVVYINSTYNGQPIQTRYAHLQYASYLKPGYSVAAGQWIGAMGNTGTSSGVHLHFEVRLRKSNATCIANADSTPVNPINYVG